jgi:hypothetical protein
VSQNDARKIIENWENRRVDYNTARRSSHGYLTPEESATSAAAPPASLLFSRFAEITTDNLS